MAKRELKATLGLAAIALALGSCGLSAGDALDGPYARLGPAEAPGKLHYEEEGRRPPAQLIAHTALRDLPLVGPHGRGRNALRQGPEDRHRAQPDSQPRVLLDSIA